MNLRHGGPARRRDWIKRETLEENEILKVITDLVTGERHFTTERLLATKRRPSLKETETKMSSTEQNVNACGWAATDSSGILSPFYFTRRANGDSDITIKIFYFGICHTDLLLAKDEIGITIYPLVPGHEIVGQVTKVGRNVSKFRVGDKAGVGSIADSCGKCDHCNEGEENYCHRVNWFFNGQFEDGLRSYGGFSDKTVINQRYAVRFPDGFPLDDAGPLRRDHSVQSHDILWTGTARYTYRCGGAWRAGPFGHEVCKSLEGWAIWSSRFIYGQSPPRAIAAPPPELPILPLILGRKLIAGSACGGMKEAEEMVDFAANHNITADIEVVPMDCVNTGQY
ncbi:hypothetical protein FEM48_Zijuj08G0142500 [Ziziphus jujuba var. spinosa]|uniref:Alcohol dehydrogenase-like N-terminal domain-containing protein n=1 Tax=Ziziphus jujuba var. spinosa TaxID=714518 RepID=A0A978UZL0_ZIZJJ|nr:hypothetical protein FEM48_Zijuj08G0142500 [Ziziphus jujuba var. spinosa]